MKQSVRISRAIAMAGICSRRKAENLVLNGNVKINNAKIEDLASKVKHNDLVSVNNSIFKVNLEQETRIWKYYKIKGLVSTRKDEKNRPNIFDDIKKTNPQLPDKLISIGRLDLNSEGLILLTNDGETAQSLMLPKFGFIRKYQVRALGKPPKNISTIAEKGLKISGIYYKPLKIIHQKQKDNAANQWYIVEIQEGKNREIRKIFQHLKLTVNKLTRTQFANVSLKGMQRGQVKEVKQEIVTQIKKQIEQNAYHSRNLERQKNLLSQKC